MILNSLKLSRTNFFKTFMVFDALTKLLSSKVSLIHISYVAMSGTWPIYKILSQRLPFKRNLANHEHYF